MQFPLYHRPNAIVFLDDDAGYLDMLADVMPQDWCVQLYTHAGDCIDHMKRQHGQWESDVNAHVQMTENWRAGIPLIPQLLEYWQTQTQRYGFTNVLVVDYSMPAMTGLDVLLALPTWPAQRVLLTGQADESMAVKVFNQRLINQFVAKQHPHIGQHLAQVVRELNALPLSLHDSIWRNALKKEQYDYLQTDAVQQALTALVKERSWVEYFVIAEPFGILGINGQAVPQWLQLEHIQGLPDAAELAESAGQSNQAAQKIRLGSHLTNAELAMALSCDAPLALAPAFPIGPPGALLGAFFDLPKNCLAGRGYCEFLCSLPSRGIG
jgi:CheY-like chemotaxis protein